MYQTDINEFKNEKILGNLNEARQIFNSLNEMKQVIQQSNLSLSQKLRPRRINTKPSKEIRSCKTPPLLKSAMPISSEENAEKNSKNLVLPVLNVSSVEAANPRSPTKVPDKPQQVNHFELINPFKEPLPPKKSVKKQPCP